jgi:xylan 1,4-beta-xylosidase
VDGAAGYVVYRSGEGGQLSALDHGGSDVEAVPAPPYADTDVQPGARYRYAVAAVGDAGSPPGSLSETVEATPAAGPAALLTVRVDAGDVAGRLRRVWRLVGSERLSQLWEGEDRRGNAIGREFRAALALARSELGVERVRAHALLHDDVGAFSWDGGGPRYDFDGVDRIYDELLELGLRPVVEVSFMPRDLAADPDATVFDYRGIVSPPRDWSVWSELNRRLAEHLVARYGIDEVASWGFEIWNEPNLSVFWTGSQDDYFRLYRAAAEAVKAVDERLLVGGPATAAAAWIEDFAAFVAETGTPLDFVSTHTYGNVPLDVRPALRRHGLEDVEVWWTEWGAGATHFGPIHDAPYGAPFVLRGLKGVQGRVDELAYWVVSDHFEELGRPPRLLHNGFGLLTVGNLRKPRYWAVRLAAELGDEVLRTEVTGDGAVSLVDAWAAARDGRVDVLVWNGALNAAKFRGDPALDRTVRLRLEGLQEERYDARLARIDERHSNIARHVPEGVDWPTDEQWEGLRREDRLAEEPLDDFTVHAGAAELELELPMPGVARLRLEPQRARSKGGTQE